MNENNSENMVAQVLKIIGFCTFVGALVLGTISGQSYGGFSWQIASIYWFTGILCVTLIVGLAEIISLLNSIKINTNKL